MNRLTKSEAIFKVASYTLVIIFALFCLFPLLYAVAIAFSSLDAYNSGTITFFPKEFTTIALLEVIGERQFWAAYSNTLFLTIYGTAFSMLISIFAAYALSRKNLPGRNKLSFMIVFTMWFSAGLIPTYRNYLMLGVDNLWMFVVGFGAQAFNIMLLRNSFDSVPHEIEEASRVDGANDFKILTSVYLPMSKSALATVTLFYALNRWNGYYWAQRLLRGNNQPLQAYLVGYIEHLMSNDNIVGIHPQSIGYAAILLAIIPIVIIYPYLQKYFAAGVNVGGVKE